MFEVARYGDQPGAFIANALAVPLGGIGGLSHQALEIGFSIFWWLHMLIVAAFLVYLPGSKHLHIATAFPNIYFRKLEPRGELPAMDLEAEDATFGLRTLADLGWNDLLDGFTCTECGRCQQACPAWNTGKPLNPKHFIMGIRDMSVEAEHGLPLIPNSPSAVDLRARRRHRPEAMLASRSSTTRSRTTPSGTASPAAPASRRARSSSSTSTRSSACGATSSSRTRASRRSSTARSGTWRASATPGASRRRPGPTGRRASRSRSRSSPTSPRRGELGELDVLYWVGCAAAFDERNRKVARAFATCLDAAGINFAILGQEESCTGDPARRMGNDYVFQMLASGNVETLNRYRMGERTIVTACPHCFNSIGNEYGQLGGNFRVVHHSAFLRELLADGRLRVIDADAAPTAPAVPAAP